jgi:hypothetical protein
MLQPVLPGSGAFFYPMDSGSGINLFGIRDELFFFTINHLLLKQQEARFKGSFFHSLFYLGSGMNKWFRNEKIFREEYHGSATLVAANLLAKDVPVT